VWLRWDKVNQLSGRFLFCLCVSIDEEVLNGKNLAIITASLMSIVVVPAFANVGDTATFKFDLPAASSSVRAIQLLLISA